MARQRDGRKTVSVHSAFSHPILLRGSRFRIHHDTLGPVRRPATASAFFLSCFLSCIPLFLTVNLKPRRHVPRRRLRRLNIDIGTERGNRRKGAATATATLIETRKGEAITEAMTVAASRIHCGFRFRHVTVIRPRAAVDSSPRDDADSHPWLSLGK